MMRMVILKCGSFSQAHTQSSSGKTGVVGMHPRSGSSSTRACTSTNVVFTLLEPMAMDSAWHDCYTAAFAFLQSGLYRAWLKSAVSGIGHQSHTTKKQVDFATS